MEAELACRIGEMIDQKPSKLNTAVDVPAISATLRTAVASCGAPRTPMHAADVCVVQLLVAQSAEVSAEVRVVSVGAKLMPTRVTLAVKEGTL